MKSKLSFQSIQEKVLLFLKEWVPIMATALIVGFLVQKFLFIVPVVPTGSMIPTININDRVFVSKIFSKDNLEYKDIVIFNPPIKDTENIYLKRVIGIAGDTIEVKNGTLYINGKAKEENFIYETMDYTYGPVTVPDGHIFVLGDNRNDSFDSHLWEETPFVNIKEVEGKALLKVFPFNDIGKLK